MTAIAVAFLCIQNALTRGGIRSKPEDEKAGLDLPEMGVLAYPEFIGDELELELAAVEEEEPAPVA